ncbi:hypothetical protein GGTG_11964 [Gaeumannomyces tritici R3-111a-1]|uniref:Uncharacterized protein n=1 Tax=Gaeumannomyces tritici (strain R3-111a-1) TaxID=644352 RepID=J3PEN3_GAET3|nr:hypothetical protein GGTG_11964 [Gaeumannomyces tritici R3-111a-1]EJT70941.1 hypothetical protein GGTG_11964 [Gaeumannomyces tritici R3-111a-1]
MAYLQKAQVLLSNAAKVSITDMGLWTPPRRVCGREESQDSGRMGVAFERTRLLYYWQTCDLKVCLCGWGGPQSMLLTAWIIACTLAASPMLYQEGVQSCRGCWPLLCRLAHDHTTNEIF